MTPKSGFSTAERTLTVLLVIDLGVFVLELGASLFGPVRSEHREWMGLVLMMGTGLFAVAVGAILGILMFCRRTRGPSAPHSADRSR